MSRAGNALIVATSDPSNVVALDDLKFLKAFGYWRDLSKDKADDGSKMNDRIDGVQVC